MGTVSKAEKIRPSRGIKGRKGETGEREEGGQRRVFLFGPGQSSPRHFSWIRGSPAVPPL